jgi:hypothetical protein
MHEEYEESPDSREGTVSQLLYLDNNETEASTIIAVEQAQYLKYFKEFHSVFITLKHLDNCSNTLLLLQSITRCFNLEKGIY